MTRPDKRDDPGQGVTIAQPVVDTSVRPIVYTGADYVTRCCGRWRPRAPGKRKRPATTPGAPSTSSAEIEITLPDLLDTDAAEHYEHCLWEYHLVGECSRFCAWCPGGRWAA